MSDLNAAQPLPRRRPPVGDIALAAALAVVLAVMCIAVGLPASNDGLFVLSVAVGIAECAALAWRRVAPHIAAASVAAFALAHVAFGQVLQPSDVAVLVALYSVTVHGSPQAGRWWLLVAGVGAAIVGGGFAMRSVSFGSAIATAAFFFIGCAALALAAWALGLMRRAGMLQRASQAQQEARELRDRTQLAQIATQAERTRIAREMHDIVAHSLSVVIAQADGGRYAARHDAEAAERALTTISETGRAALADMRRILGVLRADEADAADLVPQPADADIAALVASVKETMPVSLVELGTPRAMPPGTGSAIYRIAQEALTNVLKHSGPGAHATVLVHWTPQRLILQIDDDGRGAAATTDGIGHGVIGMHERAGMLGGTLVAGPRPGGGFRVRAEIPIPGGIPNPAQLTPTPARTA